MIMIIRHALSIALLPFTVAVVVPLWIARRYAIALSPDVSLAHRPLQLLGLVVLAIGGALFVSSLRRFHGEGHGTLAPWDPPRQMVVRGPYRYVRNPIYVAVVAIILGQAILFGDWRLAIYGGFMWLAFHAFVLAYEEPVLAQTFGAQYEEFRANVPRWIPRLSPWRTA